MKLETLKTIESVLNASIMEEETKIREARVQLEDALRDALNKPKIGRGRKIPTLPYEADSRISELRAALKDFSSISWRE